MQRADNDLLTRFYLSANEEWPSVKVIFHKMRRTSDYMPVVVFVFNGKCHKLTPDIDNFASLILTSSFDSSSFMSFGQRMPKAISSSSFFLIK